MSEPVRTAWAEAKCNGDFICIETYSGYRSCSRDPYGKQFLLSTAATDLELGTAVLDALSCSRFVKPREDLSLFDYKLLHPLYVEWVNDLLLKYGYKSKRALFKNMDACGILRRENTIIISPTHHEKLEAWSGEGISDEDHVRIPAGSAPADIGAALRLAFSRCT